MHSCTVYDNHQGSRRNLLRTRSVMSIIIGSLHSIQYYYVMQRCILIAQFIFNQNLKKLNKIKFIRVFYVPLKYVLSYAYFFLFINNIITNALYNIFSV